MQQVLDKTFVPFIKSELIQSQVEVLAQQINKDYKDKNPLFLGILNGCFIFAADLYKEITIQSEISFVKIASYEGTESSGKIITSIGLDKTINNRHIIIIEDIIDTGFTLHSFIQNLKNDGALSVEVAVLLDKKPARQFNIDIKYSCFDIENKFVLGYGLDYDGYGRNSKDIYILKENE